jgi:tRNA modification GTPase
LRDGLWVVIAGPPNAGKSTLLNRIARREAAIVSPHAGTTRDVIEVHLDLAGYPVNLIDTAGIRAASEDPVEREGMARARAAAGRADLVLWLVDASAADARALACAQDEPLNPGASRWIVVNKMDVVDAATKERLASLFGGEQFGNQEFRHEQIRNEQNFPRAAGQDADRDRHRQDAHRDGQHTMQHAVHYVSAATGAGLDALIAAVVQFAERTFTLEPALVTRERQRVALQAVTHALAGAIRHAETSAGEELVAEDLRHAATHLGRLTGRVDVEELLEVIFREFCVGK